MQSIQSSFLWSHWPQDSQTFLPASQMQRPDDEWCRLGISPLSFEYEDMDPEEFWHCLNLITDGTDIPPLKILCNFMKMPLCLPHANMDVERTFSDVTAVKTKNKLFKGQHSQCTTPS